LTKSGSKIVASDPDPPIDSHFSAHSHSQPSLY
jgi:hypothetical protein